MVKKICVLCKKETEKYLKSCDDIGVICIECYYGKKRTCFCEYCNKKFSLKLFDTLRNRVVCPVCKRKNFIKEKGGLVHEDLTKVRNMAHFTSYYFIVPKILEKYFLRLQKRRFKNKGFGHIIYVAITDLIIKELDMAKIKKKERCELLGSKYRLYHRGVPLPKKEILPGEKQKTPGSTEEDDKRK
jgi:hypothetical protein